MLHKNWKQFMHKISIIKNIIFFPCIYLLLCWCILNLFISWKIFQSLKRVIFPCVLMSLLAGILWTCISPLKIKSPTNSKDFKFFFSNINFFLIDWLYKKKTMNDINTQKFYFCIILIVKIKFHPNLKA